MDESAIVTVLQGASEQVFSAMLGSEITFGNSYNETNPPGPSTGVIAVIGLAGAWVGTACLCCGADTAWWMASRMLGMEFAEVNEEVLDAVSEITNMIVGSFKTEAEAHFGPLGLSIPTVVYGFSFTARTASKERWVVVPIASDGHPLDIKICLTPNRGLPLLGTPAAGQLRTAKQAG
jgi:chemotaxis protein CheX